MSRFRAAPSVTDIAQARMNARNAAATGQGVLPTGQTATARQQALESLKGVNGRSSSSSVFAGVDRAGQQSRLGGGGSAQNFANAPVPRGPNIAQAPPPPTREPPVSEPSALDAAREAAKQKARQETLAATQNGAVPYQPGGMDELARQRYDQQQERNRLEQEQKAQRAQALQQAASVSNLGGFGLSGASANMQTDLGNKISREQSQAMTDLERQQHDEDFQRTQQQAQINDAELAANTDLDGDHKIAGHSGPGWGTGDPEDEPGDQSGGGQRDLAAQLFANGANGGGSGKDNDPYGGVGGMSTATLHDLVDGGETFSNMRVERGLVNGEVYVVAKGSDGNWYKIKVEGTGWGNSPSDGDALAWFKKQMGGA